jgi:NAD(P)-dependent dehydrogenase (short-subunit alcohol dehydrogenase family)
MIIGREKIEGSNMELEDQIAIVTGAGRGIGEAIALRFSSEGAHVVVNDINLDDAKKVTQKIISMGRRALPVQTDVSSKDQVDSMVREVVKEFGTIDILVNNAGIGGCSRLVKDIPEDSWDQVMAINLKGVFLCCQAVIPIMIEKRRGKIVNIASLAARRMSFLGGADYTASKYGVVGFSHHLAYELAYYRINVNVVCPGATLTPLVDEKAPQELIDKVASRIPLGRWSRPEDQAEAVLFLVSEHAKMITGHIMDVNGGQLLGFEDYLEDMERRIKASAK